MLKNKNKNKRKENFIRFKVERLKKNERKKGENLNKKYSDKKQRKDQKCFYLYVCTYERLAFIVLMISLVFHLINIIGW